MHADNDLSDSIVGFVVVATISAIAVYFMGGISQLSTPLIWIATMLFGATTWTMKLVISSIIQWVVTLIVLSAVVAFGKKYFKKEKTNEVK